MSSLSGGFEVHPDVVILILCVLAALLALGWHHLLWSLCNLAFGVRALRWHPLPWSLCNSVLMVTLYGDINAVVSYHVRSRLLGGFKDCTWQPTLTMLIEDSGLA